GAVVGRITPGIEHEPVLRGAQAATLASSLAAFSALVEQAPGWRDRLAGERRDRRGRRGPARDHAGAGGGPQLELQAHHEAPGKSPLLSRSWPSKRNSFSFRTMDLLCISDVLGHEELEAVRARIATLPRV